MGVYRYGRGWHKHSGAGEKLRAGKYADTNWPKRVIGGKGENKKEIIKNM